MSFRNVLRASTFNMFSKRAFSCHIDVIRHATSFGNKEKIVQGSSDSLHFSLTDEGRNSVLPALANITKPDVLISSSLLRCKQTAEAWFGCDFDAIPIPKKCDPALREINAGDYEGRYIHTLAQDPLWKSWLANPLTFRGFTNGETAFEFQHRVLTAFSTICSHYNNTSQRVCVITHGIVMRALLLYLNKKDLSQLWTYEVANLERLTLTKDNINLLLAYSEHSLQQPLRNPHC